MQDTNKDKNLVNGHRQRLKNRFFTCGTDSLSEHELLELLLFYSIPRRDTKLLAKKLLCEYGSLESVILASEDALEKSGLGQSSIVLFKLFSGINSSAMRSSVRRFNSISVALSVIRSKSTNSTLP